MQSSVVNIDEILCQHRDNRRILDDFLSGDGGKYALSAMATEILKQENCANNRKLVGYLQLLSKLLKLNRSASHPEREIGKSRGHVSISNIIDVNEIINIGVINIHTYLHKIGMVAIDCTEKSMTEHKVSEDRIKPAINLSHSDIFFIYSFVLDVLKEFILPQKKHALHESRDDNILKLVNTIIDHFEKLNIEYIVNYTPIVHRLNDIVNVLLQTPVFGRIDTIKFYQKLSVFVIKLCCRQYETTTALLNNFHFNYFNCSFIENNGYSAISHGMHLLMQILNYALTYVTTNETNQLSLISINRLLEEITTNYLSVIRVRGIDEILKLLSEDDKEIISFLIIMVENVLRLEYLVGNTNNLAARLDRYLVQNVYDVLQDCGCDVISLFTYFISGIICYDSTVLLDLLINNETLALKYLLRATAYLENRIKSTHDLEGISGLYGEFYASLKQSSMINNKQHLNEAGDITTDVSQTTVVVYENYEAYDRPSLDTQDWSPCAWPSVIIGPSHSYSKSESLGNVIKCLEEIAVKLLRFDKLPFQPGKLCARLVAITKELIRGEKQYNQMLHLVPL